MIILGRLFLSTARAIVDIHDSKLTVRVGYKEIVFGVIQAIKSSQASNDEFFFMDGVDEAIQDDSKILHEEHKDFDELMELKKQCKMILRRS